jgi:hypothetical protein
MLLSSLIAGRAAARWGKVISDGTRSIDLLSVDHHAVLRAAMQASGSDRFHFSDLSHFPATQAFELDVFIGCRARGGFAAQTIFQRTLADISQHAGARSAPPAPRLYRFQPFDLADLSTTETLESNVAIPIHAHDCRLNRIAKLLTLHHNNAECAIVAAVAELGMIGNDTESLQDCCAYLHDRGFPILQPE